MASQKGSASVVGALLLVASAGCGFLLGDPKQGPTDAGTEGDASGQEASADTNVPRSGDDAQTGSDVAVGSDAQGGIDAPFVAMDSGGAGGDGATQPDAGRAAYVTSCSTTGAACSCNAPDPGNPGAANGTECDTTAVQGSVCCADANWPEPGSTCSCLTASCTHPGGGGCDCTLGGDGQSCNDGVVCCVAPSPDSECLCTYGVSSCWDGYRSVGTCDAPAIGCGANNLVSSCSIPSGT